MKQVLLEAGINLTILSPHSVRNEYTRYAMFLLYLTIMLYPERTDFAEFAGEIGLNKGWLRKGYLCGRKLFLSKTFLLNHV